MSEMSYPAIPDPEGVERVYGELLARAPENKMAPRLDAVRRAVEILGDVHRAAPVIHITGTNGKTSTARMIESLLLAHDLRTGRFTSPHLESVTERISINGEPVPDATFVRVWDEILPYLTLVDEEFAARGEPKLTFFESITVLAFAIFADEPVDVVILEVGIGGSWDSTNVADGIVSVVAPVGLDHTDMLGDTLAEIATEKAGIIKPDGYLISAAQDPEVATILLDTARKQNAKYAFEGVEFGVVERARAVGGQLLTLRGLAGEYPDIELPLHGEHQGQNASLALAAVEAFFGGDRALARDVVLAGFAQVRSPGRLEMIRSEPLVVLDAAHNPHGVRAASTAFKEAFELSHVHAVVGILGEKDALGIFEVLREEYVDSTDATFRLYLSASDSSRAIAPEELQEIALDAGFDEDIITVCDHLDEALATAMETPSLSRNPLVCWSQDRSQSLVRRVPCWHSPEESPAASRPAPEGLDSDIGLIPQRRIGRWGCWMTFWRSWPTMNLKVTRHSSDTLTDPESLNRRAVAQNNPEKKQFLTRAQRDWKPGMKKNPVQ